MSEGGRYALSRRQWLIFASATFGYGLYYVCRLSLSVTKVPLIADGVLTEAQAGLVGSALFYAYALGKLVNGFFADRVSLRLMFAFGLLASAVVNFVLGFGPAFAVFLALWAANGWVQSMGAPACVVGLTRWFDRRQRGTFYGLWSSSHNIGEGLTFLVTAAVVGGGGWRAGFGAAGATGAVGALFIWLLYRDAPRPAGASAPAGRVNAAQSGVLRSPIVWCIALASACMYVTRYAVNSWGVFYFQHVRGYSTVEAGGLVAIGSVCGVIGTVASGWISDSLFRGDRFTPAIWFGLLNIAALGLLLVHPPAWRWCDAVAMIGWGLAIGALVCYLGGLMAVDAVPPAAAGAALGVVGIASYLGAGTQDVLSGWLIEKGRTGTAAAGAYDFTFAGLSWLAAAAGCILLTAVARRHHLRHQLGPAPLEANVPG